MRLKYNFFKWATKTRLIIGGVLWGVIAIIAFFCSETGQSLKKWTSETINIAFEKVDCRLKTIDVTWQEPIHYTKTEEILKTIGIAQGDSVSAIRLREMQQKIEALPWVRSATIERFWPHDLKIIITEKIPLALWQNNRRYHPLDEKGEVIDTTTQLPADLLLVVGADAPEHLIPLIQDLKKVPAIYHYVRAAVRVGGRRWNLRLFDAEKGLEVLLPETNIQEALSRLDKYHQEKNLIKRQLVAIDLRANDKIVLKPIPAPPSPSKTKVSKK